LQFYVVNEQVSVVNEIPYLDNGKANGSIQALLLAILKALKIDLELLPEPQVFRWPLAADDEANVERLPEAMLALEGFMHKRLESFSGSHLLVLAGQCKELLQGEKGNSKVFGDTQAKIVITHSLHAMLRIPVLKKQVWEDIRSLQGKLSNGSDVT
jgi:hypothetical protein